MCGQMLIMSPDLDMVLSIISEDNSFQDMCDAYWETIFASAVGDMRTYRMDPLFKEELTAGDVLPENPDALAALRAAEDNWTAVELLGGEKGAYEGTLTLSASSASAVDVLVDGEFILAEKDITLLFRGSRNQRLIDLPASLKEGKVLLWEQR